MNFDFSKVTLSIEEEKKLYSEFENRILNPNKENVVFFKKAVRGYKDFDFSQLDFLNESNLLYKTRDAFFEHDELASRPLLFPMFIFYRNGYLDRDKSKIDNLEFEYDLLKLDHNSISLNCVPQGLITEDGVLHTCGVDGHMWLYYFLNLAGLNTKNIIRYGVWVHPDTKELNQKFTRLEKNQNDRNFIFLSNEQAVGMNNLRRFIDPRLSLEGFLKTKTENMGFVPGEPRRVFECNFDVFDKLFPTEPLERNSFVEDNFMSKFLLR